MTGERRHTTPTGAAGKTSPRLEEIRAALGGGRAALERELDMVSFQAREIREAGFSPGEDQRLATEARRLRNSEALRGHLGMAGEGLETARESLAETSGELNAALRLDPGLDDLMSLIDSVEQLMEDATYQLEGAGEDLESDSATLEDLERRLALLGKPAPQVRVHPYRGAGVRRPSLPAPG